MNNNKDAVCTGACIFGKCPNKVCVRHLQKERAASQIKAGMQIMMDAALPEILSDKTGLGVAVDIGTTTVVAYLVDCTAGKLVGRISRLNAQVNIGVDVISRIHYCMEHERGLALLNDAIVTELNDLIGILCNDHGAAVADIRHMVITGNTTILHLMARISPVSMGTAPFEPESRFGFYKDAEALGLKGINARVYLMPCISAFVGGDITAAVMSSGLYNSDKLCILLDIGTNGEVVLGSRDGIYATSTAAGPAFEGAHISCGMAGVPGAVSSVKAYKGEIEIETIGGVGAKGICGSGLLDAVALMLSIGAIDETGRILSASEADVWQKPYLTTVDGENALRIPGDIVLKQKDIREVQMAKAAVAAGVLSLLHHAQVDISDVETFYLAGGFGNFLDPQSAIRVGLLPVEAAGRIRPIGNAAGTGAIMALLNDDYIHTAEHIAEKGEHVELGHNPYFMDQYIKQMTFDTGNVPLYREEYAVE